MRAAKCSIGRLRFAVNRTDCVGEFADEFLLVGLVNYVRRRQQNMIANAAIDSAAHPIDHQTTLHRRLLHPIVVFAARVQRRFGVIVGNELDANEQPAPADVPDIWM